MTHTIVPDETFAASCPCSGTTRSSELTPGGRFILINDHDPKPLYYQFEAEHPGQFSWTYLEGGPQVWRVEIGRLSKAA